MSGYYVVTVALDEDAVSVDDTFDTIDTTELADSETSTISLGNAKPGLYYSIVGGTDLTHIATEGERVLAMANTVSPAKPKLEGDGKSAFFRINVSASAE